MKRLIVITIVLFGVLFGSLGTLHASQIITGREIRESGIMRLSDIYRLFEDWSVSSIDGYTWAASPNGLTPTGNQQWRIMIDDIPVEIDLLGVRNIGRLPITLSEIDYIELISRPEFRGGILIDAGMINIHLREPESDGTLSVEVSAGNETGDPGPFRYTEYETPNVDKIGRNDGAAAGISGKRYFAALSAREDISYYSDPGLVARIHPVLVDEYPRLKMIGGMGRLGWNDPEIDLELLGISSNLNDLFYDFRRGNEIPARDDLRALAFRNSFNPAPGLDFLTQVSYSDNALRDRNRETLFEFFDWRQKSLYINFDFKHRTSKVTAIVGGTSRYVKTETGYDLTDDDIRLLSCHADVRFNLREDLESEFAAELVNGSDLGYKLMMHHRLEVSKKTDAEATVCFSRKSPEELNYYWAWRKRGYLFADTNDTAYRRSTADYERKLSVDLAISNRPSNDLRMTAGLYFRNFADLNSDYLTYQVSFSGPPVIYSDGSYGSIAEGKIFGGYLKQFWNISNRLKLSGYYRYQVAFDGFNGFENRFDNVPRHFARATLSYFPEKDITVWMAGSYQSETFWREFTSAEFRRPEDFTTEIDGFFQIDLSLQKYFWDRKLRGTISFRNILDDEVRYHAIGASHDLSYYALIEFTPF